MPTHEAAARNGAPAGRARARRQDVEGAGAVRGFVRMGRGLPAKVRAEMRAEPELVLAAVAGAAFVAGAVLGSRLGRAILGAAIPIGVERLLTSELAPDLLRRAKKALEGLDAEPTAN